MADEKLNLYQKLAKIRKIVDVVTKQKSGFKYTYADINEILAKVKGGMERYGVSLIPEVLAESPRVQMQELVSTNVMKDGSTVDKKSYEYLVCSDMVFRWVNDENPEENIMVPWYIVGSQADPSQAFGSGLTYCTRYFLLNYFQIAQDNDVDKYRSEQKAAAEKEERETAATIIKKLDGLVHALLADNPDKRDDVMRFMKRFTKDGNYNRVVEPAIAAKMLSDFGTAFGVSVDE